MMNFLTQLGTKKVEAILVAMILFGLVCMFKESITTLLTDILLSELNGSIIEILK